MSDGNLFSSLKVRRRQERGLNIRRQRLTSPTPLMLVAQTTRPVQNVTASRYVLRLRLELTRSVLKRENEMNTQAQAVKTQAEDAARASRWKTKRRMATGRTAQRDKCSRFGKTRSLHDREHAGHARATNFRRSYDRWLIDLFVKWRRVRLTGQLIAAAVRIPRDSKRSYLICNLRAAGGSNFYSFFFRIRTDGCKALREMSLWEKLLPT